MVIGKVLRGQRPAGLIRYLYGPGRREEHRDPHLFAGWRDPAELEPPLRPGGRRDFRRLAGLLTQPHAALGPRGLDRPVWHCVVRAAPGDRLLSDAEWGQLARDIMDRTGLAPHGQDDEAVRWVAVRHAPDHIHIVGMLARQDGARPQFWNDYYRVREACHAAEERHGLRRTAPADRTAGRRPSRAEQEKARRRGRAEAPRITLRRAVATAAAGAGSEDEFFARLGEAGVLVRARYSTRNPGQLTGYAVALPGDTAQAGGSVWFGGGKLLMGVIFMGWSRKRSGQRGKARYTSYYRDARGKTRAAGTFSNRKDADSAWKAAEVRQAEGRLGDPRRGRQTFQRYVEGEWLPNHVIEVTTREGYTYSIGKHIMPWFGPLRMSQIMPSDVREWVTHLTQTGVSPASIRTLKSILGAVFTTALNDQVTFLHPCKGVRTPTVPPALLTVVTPEQFDLFYQALPGADAKLLVETAIESGLRWGNWLSSGHGT